MGGNFIFSNEAYVVLKSGKPRPVAGECKTDLYILARQVKTNEKKEIKISIKKENYEFIENKISLETATDIFGKEALKDIASFSSSIKEAFNSTNLQPKNKKGKKITLGWKIELFLETSRKLKFQPTLTFKQKVDLFSGVNRTPEKRNSKVDGEVVSDSGVANFILILPDDVEMVKKQNVNYFSSRLQTINNYVKSLNDKGLNIDVGFTALNYRFEEDKWDSDRPLAVWINWTIKENKFCPEIILNDPFANNGNDCGEKLRKLLSSLSVNQNEQLGLF